MTIRSAELFRLLRFSLLLSCPLLGFGNELTDAQLQNGLAKLSPYFTQDIPREASWVSFENGRLRHGIFSPNEDPFAASGAAFLCAGNLEKPERVWFPFSGQPYTFPAPDAEDDNDFEAMSQADARCQQADVTKDVLAAIEWLNKQIATVKAEPAGDDSRHFLSEDPFGGFGYGERNPALELVNHRQTALRWASVLQHTGKASEALQLARAATAGLKSGEMSPLLDGIFASLANASYQQALKQLVSDRNWVRFRDELNSLIERFPQGWPQRDAARVLLHYVTERAKDTEEPAYKTGQFTLTSDQKQTLNSWFDELATGKISAQSFWTLPALDDETSDEMELRDHETTFPRSHGLSAVPILAAVLADDTLLAIKLGPRLGGMTYFDSHQKQSPAEALRSEYERFPKPPTRSSIAWSGLQGVLPNELSSNSDTQPSELIPDILAWYHSLKDSSPPDLALGYLEEGQSDDLIIAHAINQTDPKKFARLEEALLEQLNLWNLLSLRPFVEKLGPEKAMALLGKVKEKLETDLTEYGDDKQSRKQMESGLKRLEAAAKGEIKRPDLPSLLATLAAYDPEDPDTDEAELYEASNEMAKLLKKLSFTEQLVTILKALPDFKSPLFAGQMFEFIAAEQNRQNPLQATERKALLEKTASHWKALIESIERKDPSGEQAAFLASVIFQLEWVANGQANQGDPAQLYALGERGIQILRARADVWLAGQTPDPLPSAAAIPESERKSLLADLGSKSPDDFARSLATLEIEKLLAINEAIQRGATLPDGLLAHTHRIQDVRLKDISDPATWQKWKGKTVNDETLVQLSNQMATDKSPSIFSIQLSQSNPLSGYTLHVSELPKLGSDWQTNVLQEITSFIELDDSKKPHRASVAYYQKAQVNEQWSWLDAPTTETASAPTVPDKDKEESANEPQRRRMLVTDNDEVEDNADEALQEMREAELHAWQKIKKAFEENPSVPSSFYLLSAPTSLLQSTD